MVHLFNETEVAKLTMLISEDYLNTDIEDIDKVQNVIRTLNRKISAIKDKETEQNFIFDIFKEKYVEKNYTRYEAHILIYLMITNTRRGSFYSDAFTSPDDITYEKANAFYKDLIEFLNDERFANDGEWYNYEKIFCKEINDKQQKELFGTEIETIEELGKDEIENLTKNFADYVRLLEQIERYELLAPKRLGEHYGKIIKKSDFSHFPILSVDDEMVIKNGMLAGYKYGVASEILEIINNKIEETIIEILEEANSALTELKKTRRKK